MKDFAIEWYKERAKQPKYQSQVNEIPINQAYIGGDTANISINVII